MATSRTEIIGKLRQIEEQARAALAEMPSGTPKDRVVLVMGIAGHLALRLDIEKSSDQRSPASNDGSRERREA